MVEAAAEEARSPADGGRDMGHWQQKHRLMVGRRKKAVVVGLVGVAVVPAVVAGAESGGGGGGGDDFAAFYSKFGPFFLIFLFVLQSLIRKN